MKKGGNGRYRKPIKKIPSKHTQLVDKLFKYSRHINQTFELTNKPFRDGLANFLEKSFGQKRSFEYKQKIRSGEILVITINLNLPRAERINFVIMPDEFPTPKEIEKIQEFHANELKIVENQEAYFFSKSHFAKYLGNDPDLFAVLAKTLDRLE